MLQCSTISMEDEHMNNRIYSFFEDFGNKMHSGLLNRIKKYGRHISHKGKTTLFWQKDLHEWEQTKCIADFDCNEVLFYQCKTCGQGQSLSGRTFAEEERCTPNYYSTKRMEEINAKYPKSMTWIGD